MPIQTTNLGERRIIDLQADLAGLNVNELRAFLGALEAMGLPLPPVLALAQVALTGGPLITKTYAREEWLDLIRAGRAFSRAWNRAAGGVGTQSILQLWNPGNSGLTGLVYGLQAYSSTAYGAGTFISVALDTVAQANVTTPSFSTNLKAGGGGVGLELRDGTPASLPATAARFADRPALTAFGFADFAFPLSGSPQAFIAEIPPGFGLDILPGLGNTSLFGYVQYAEVPAPPGY